MNYLYVIDGNTVIGFTLTNTPEELKNDIPKGCPFYYYAPGDNIQRIIDEEDPVGFGTGIRIDFDCLNMG